MTQQLQAVLELLRDARHEDGEHIFVVDPPFAESVIASWPNPPPGLVELATQTRSVRGDNGLGLDLPEAMHRYDDDFLRSIVEIGNDGIGGYWYLDPIGRVWWHGLDPSVIAFAGIDITSFLARALTWREEKMPDRWPREPAAVQSLRVGETIRVPLDALAPGEGFNFHDHRVDPAGDSFIVTRATGL